MLQSTCGYWQAVSNYRINGSTMSPSSTYKDKAKALWGNPMRC